MSESTYVQQLSLLWTFTVLEEEREKNVWMRNAGGFWKGRRKEKKAFYGTIFSGQQLLACTCSVVYPAMCAEKMEGKTQRKKHRHPFFCAWLMVMVPPPPPL